MDNLSCLCGSGINSSDCCQRFIVSEDHPTTAEALMRSRFTAYAQKNETYLLSTWDDSSKKKPKYIDFSKEGDVVWTQLDIIQCKKGAKNDKKGIVEFKAHYTLDGKPYVMHEISRFVNKNGRWFYLDGLVKSVARANQQVNEGKNKPCPCGSGKKYKRCCGK
ncbi:YchJ family protein [methane-oxidizing endosymbiont of Gigantopelta aegis]|uniref:YchJ family protein n=1 Tax=methane-oxidizing endosymbiont of Gigantopelta aegis TaxID=2794938 RepID=UPI0018DBF854|nr:YchJ family protein [methane-oxidizing endosymbiont of Gigantopelta aegis]